MGWAKPTAAGLDRWASPTLHLPPSRSSLDDDRFVVGRSWTRGIARVRHLDQLHPCQARDLTSMPSMPGMIGPRVGAAGRRSMRRTIHACPRVAPGGPTAPDPAPAPMLRSDPVLCEPCDPCEPCGAWRADRAGAACPAGRHDDQRCLHEPVNGSSDRPELAAGAHTPQFSASQFRVAYVAYVENGTGPAPQGSGAGGRSPGSRCRWGCRASGPDRPPIQRPQGGNLADRGNGAVSDPRTITASWTLNCDLSV